MRTTARYLNFLATGRSEAESPSALIPATQLLERGTHPKVVQERLGHTTITTTMNIYSHVTPTMQRSAIDELARQLSEA